MKAHVAGAAWFDGAGVATVSARPAGLTALGELLAAGTDTTISLSGEPKSDGSPVSAVVGRIEDEAGLAVSREGTAIIITGHPSAFATLGRNIARLGNAPEALGGHIHVDYFPQHPYLRIGSVPLGIQAVGLGASEA